MRIIYKSILAVLFFINTLYAFDYKAFGIGGDLKSAKSSITLNGEVYTLLPFSDLNINQENVNKDGEYTVLIGTINGKEINPIKIASNYRGETFVIKVFKGTNIFNETTLISQSNEIYINNSYEFFNITIY